MPTNWRQSLVNVRLYEWMLTWAIKGMISLLKREKKCEHTPPGNLMDRAGSCVNFRNFVSVCASGHNGQFCNSNSLELPQIGWCKIFVSLECQEYQRLLPSAITLLSVTPEYGAGHWNLAFHKQLCVHPHTKKVWKKKKSKPYILSFSNTWRRSSDLYTQTLAIFCLRSH
jgi:hypothetical protein